MPHPELPTEVAQLTDAYLAIVDRVRPGLVTGLLLHGSLCWDEFFHESDVDFVGIVEHAASSDDLEGLEAAHAQLRVASPERRFEGFYCRAADLAAPPAHLASAPVHFQGAFDPAGRLDVNLVTWHELAERGIAVRGDLPPLHTDLDALLAFTRDNLDSYWNPFLAQLDAAGPAEVGTLEWATPWAVLGVARLHHLLARRELTSKSGAGRYVLDSLDRRWHRVAHEALAIREEPGSASNDDDVTERGVDVREFLAWAIEDSQRLP